MFNVCGESFLEVIKAIMEMIKGASTSNSCFLILYSMHHYVIFHIEYGLGKAYNTFPVGHWGFCLSEQLPFFTYLLSTLSPSFIVSITCISLIFILFTSNGF